MRILVAGGTGFIGQPLCQALAQRGHTIIIVTRDAEQYKEVGDYFVTWDELRSASTHEKLEPIDGVINLAGESLFGRWTPEKKQAILDSRLKTANALVDFMSRLRQKPRIFVNASAVGYYGFHGDEWVAEDASPGTDFLARVCVAWEKAAQRAQELGVRVVITRFGLVFHKDGGVLPLMMRPFTYFVGGVLGSGKQWVSWVHRGDAVRAIELALEDESFLGPVNVVALEPIRNEDLARLIARALRRPYWRIPSSFVQQTLGDLADAVLHGARVMPEKLLRRRFRYDYPKLTEELIKKEFI